MDEEELKKDEAAINDFWDKYESEDPFATNIEDSEKLANLAWKYMVLYKQVVAANG
jgi:hypothetical protein